MNKRLRASTRHSLVRPAAGPTHPQPTTTPPSPHISQPTNTTTADASDAASEQLLYTADQAAALLQVRPSWLRRKAAARAVPCRYVGKHLRFTSTDIHAIAQAAATPPRASQHRAGR